MLRRMEPFERAIGRVHGRRLLCVGWQNKRVSDKSITPKSNLSAARSGARLRAGSARGMVCRQSRSTV